MRHEANNMEPGAVRRALAVLRPGEEAQAHGDAAYAVGRLLATVEQLAGPGGMYRDWKRFDAGYRSVAPPGQHPTMVLKRLMRTVRQLTEMKGGVTRGAATGVLAATEVLFAEILLGDDDVPISTALEQLEEARGLYQESLTRVEGLTRLLRETLSPG
ncbi:hypothetical protein LO762_06450 [Actinocorallia sp. API 0066]|uniref:hypothetical protein n=1 Tax=Actinocorallia sp. API 0066 TaxID=2896846 RepID=UPI001E4B3C98|nr:hypothetical protein [Actinocorallia sp. API 0066]MCD0448832.1 hypothetical protein [Actinocorallia sp. API 0066]